MSSARGFGVGLRLALCRVTFDLRRSMKTSNLPDLFETITSAELSTASGGVNDGASDAAADAKLKFPGCSHRRAKPGPPRWSWRENLFRPVPPPAKLTFSRARENTSTTRPDLEGRLRAHVGVCVFGSPCRRHSTVVAMALRFPRNSPSAAGS